MKIGFDIHGVLSNVDYMIPIINRYKSSGHLIYVISGAPVEDMKKELQDVFGYDLSLFDGYGSIADYLHSTNNHTKCWQDDRSRWWFEPESLWWEAKAKIAESFKLDIVIDDMLQYNQGYLIGKFVLYKDFVDKSWF